MSTDSWRCNNDEHINRKVDLECEICNGKRPVVELFNYAPTDDFGKIAISWKFFNADKAVLLKRDSEIELGSVNGKFVLDNVEDREDVILVLINEIATYSESLKILLEKPDIVFFNSNKTNVIEGGLVTLSWEVKNVCEVSISDIGRVGREGSLEIEAYRKSIKIVAENDIGKVDLLLSLNVLPQPSFTLFKATPSYILPGDTTEIVWNVEHVQKVELLSNGQTEIVSANEKKSITPSQTSIYRLIATALDGVTKVEQEITVEVIQPVAINHFSSSTMQVLNGKPITVEWNVAHPQSIEIKYDGNVSTVPPAGKKDIRLHATGYITLTATGRDGSRAKQNIHIEVLARPVIGSFKCTGSRIGYGQSTQISWKVENAEKVSIEGGGSIQYIPDTGSIDIAPTASETYTLTVTALDGITQLTKDIKVEVIQPVVIERFTATPIKIKPGEPVILRWATRNAADLVLVSAKNRDKNVTGVTNLTVTPKRTEVYYLKAKNSFFDQSSDPQKVIVESRISWGLIATLTVVVLVIMTIGYYRYINNEIETSLVEGIEAVSNENPNLALHNFRKAATYNKLTPQIDSLATAYEQKGDEECTFHHSHDAPDLYDLANRYYQYAATLRNQTPKVCQ